jgi:hypothetical protein
MIKLKKLLKEQKFAFDREFGEALPTLSSVIKKHQEKNEDVNEETITEASDKTGWKLYKVYDISDKLWMSMKYDLRDQFDELVKVGEDYGVFQNAQGTFKALKQIKRIMDKI